MTREQMITKCVDNQIDRGIIKKSSRDRHIKVRLSGMLKMSKKECEEWYKSVFECK